MARNGDQHDELFLIDGNSLAYRAFFALPESIATSTGFPTNAIFGFASMLVKLLTEYGSKPTVVVWDAGASGRKEVYEPYKAGRLSRPDLLREQWPHLEPLVEAFGYRNVRVDGYEADDVIASIAERAREEGVPGIGDKTASQLLQQFGSLEGVLDHVDDISGAKRKQNLTEHAQDARVSKVLATIKRDVPVTIDPAAEAARAPDRSRLREVFRQFELRAPLQRLEEALGDADAAAPPPVAETMLAARVREGTPADAAAAFPAGTEVSVAVRAPAPPEGELFAEAEPWRFGVAAGGQGMLRAPDRPGGPGQGVGDRPLGP